MDIKMTRLFDVKDTKRKKENKMLNLCIDFLRSLLPVLGEGGGEVFCKMLYTAR